MSPKVQWQLDWEAPFSGQPLEAATHASIRLTVGGAVLTELIDLAAQSTRNTLRASAYPLAMWFAENWWRLCTEPRVARSDWQETHHVAAAGRGYLWPDISVCRVGDAIEWFARPSHPVAWEGVRYIGQARQIVSIEDFEAGTSALVQSVLARLGAMGHSDSPLHALWREVNDERKTAELAAARAMEAALGYDAGAGPAGLLASYLAASRALGSEALREWAFTERPGDGPTNWVEIQEAVVRGPEAEIPGLAQLRAAIAAATPAVATPWQRGEAAARVVRQAIGASPGPLSTASLLGWLRTEAHGPDPRQTSLTAGYREADSEPHFRVLLRGRRESGRRFELARLVADHLVAASAGDRLLVSTKVRTPRQSLQRAFAAELLLPWSELARRIEREPDDEEVDAVAEEFGVSPLTVRTRLVAKGRLPADALGLSPLAENAP